MGSCSLLQGIFQTQESTQVSCMEGGKKSPGKPIRDYENLTDQRPINLTEQSTLFAPWEICMQVKKQQLELDIEQQTGSK